MYLSLYRVRQNERVFKSITGLTVTEFDDLYERFEPAWVAAEQKRLQREGRRRAVGGGRDYSLSIQKLLLMVVIWLRLYPTTNVLGFLFGLSQPTASRNTRRLLAVLHEVSKGEFPLNNPPRRGQGCELDELLQSHPDLAAIIDATEQPVERPQDREQENLHYSGKRRRSTCKASIVVNEHGVIRSVTTSAPGRTHDLTQLRQSGFLERIPLPTTVIADAGYDGLHHDLPNHSVATAHKAQRNHPLTPEHKAVNRELSSVRIIIENVFCELKHFRSLYDCFRHDVTNVHSSVFAVIAATVNHRIQHRLALSDVR